MAYSTSKLKKGSAYPPSITYRCRPPRAVSTNVRRTDDVCRSVRREIDSASNTAQSQGISYEMYRNCTIIMGMSAVTSALRIVLVGSLVTSILMSSTASYNLATLPNVQTTNLKYPYRDYAVPENALRFRCSWIKAETGCDEVFNMF